MPLLLWAVALVPGILYTIYCSISKDFPEEERTFMIVGSFGYISYWVGTALAYRIYRWIKFESSSTDDDCSREFDVIPNESAII